MPYYPDLKYLNNTLPAASTRKEKQALRRRIANNLLRLRQQIRRDILTNSSDELLRKLTGQVNSGIAVTAGDLDELEKHQSFNKKMSLKIATWNIREFAAANKGGERLTESYYYIAEIIAAFDLVAIQEVRGDLSGLQKVMKLLGKHWSYIVTDVTMGAQGNDERIAYIFDTGKVTFMNIAGELVLPERELVADGKKKVQFYRTPFSCAFQAKWFKFILNTVHIRWGTSIAARRQEIETVTRLIARRDQADSLYSYILLGDFNLIDKDTSKGMMSAISKNGYMVPEKLFKKTQDIQDAMAARTGVKAKYTYYDQIAFSKAAFRKSPDTQQEEEKQPLKRVRKYNFISEGNNAGIFNFYESVFRIDRNDKSADDEHIYKNDKNLFLNGKAGGNMNFKTWRTFQMSDHLPMWVELHIDFSDDYLQYLAYYTEGM